MWIDLILWCVYSIAEGIGNAGIFAHGAAHYMKEKQPYDIHLFFKIVRGVVLVFAFALSIHITEGDVLESLAKSCSFVLIFSFFMVGVQYETRRMLEPELSHYNFFYHSKESTARTSFNFWQRTGLMAIGAAIYYVATIV